jgi:hypothetical protein
MIPPLVRVLWNVIALASSIALAWNPQLLVRTTCDQALLQSYVGQLTRKCCKPGRRWGCDPQNFQQTGCVHIEQQYPSCQPGNLVTMKCTSASCETAGSEDVCDVRLRRVSHNRCRPLGTKTTVGCPPDHWQCNIQLFPYTLSDAPRSDQYVCELATSTICGYSYSVCD